MLALAVLIKLLFLLNGKELLMDNVARFVELTMVSCLFALKQYLWIPMYPGYQVNLMRVFCS
jgi:hypothetical protein